MRLLLFYLMFFVLTLSQTYSYAQTIVVEPKGKLGVCTVADWKRDWPNCEYEDGVKEKRLSVVFRERAKRFRVDYNVGNIGPNKGGIGWRFPITRRESVVLTYVVRFSPDFDWARGGKLPGLSGGPASVTGGRPANGKNGFSCRLMWRADGRGEAYLYHKNQKGKYGDSFSFPSDFRFPTDTDITVRMEIVMNVPERRDGKLSVWIATEGSSTETQVVRRNNIEWRSVADFGVDSVLFQTFHGGSDSTWAPSRDCWTEFGGITVLDRPSRKHPLAGCWTKAEWTWFIGCLNRLFQVHIFDRLDRLWFSRSRLSN